MTGGSEGIGYAIAYRLAEAGARVVIASRGQPAAAQAVEELTASGFTAMYVVTDVSKEEDVKLLVSKTCEKYGDIDILVNDAGIYVDHAVSPRGRDCLLLGGCNHSM